MNARDLTDAYAPRNPQVVKATMVTRRTFHAVAERFGAKVVRPVSAESLDGRTSPAMMEIDLPIGDGYRKTFHVTTGMMIVEDEEAFRVQDIEGFHREYGLENPTRGYAPDDDWDRVGPTAIALESAGFVLARFSGPWSPHDPGVNLALNGLVVLPLASLASQRKVLVAMTDVYGMPGDVRSLAEVAPGIVECMRGEGAQYQHQTSQGLVFQY